MTALMMLGLVWVVLILRDLEREPPLFNVQNYGTAPYQTHYLCYRYPRPQYWVTEARKFILGKD